jgi:hypothetical protein
VLVVPAVEPLAVPPAAPLAFDGELVEVVPVPLIPPLLESPPMAPLLDRPPALL